MADISHLLDAAAAGDRRAAAVVLPVVIDELRQLAAARLAAEAPGHTLDATALVHEAYLRLVAPVARAPGPPGSPGFDGRGHFFAAAAEAMRRILVEHARRKGSRKRGGAWARLPLDAAEVPARRSPDELLAVHDALDQLAAADARAAELVKLRYFAGFTLDQAARALGVSSRTADGVWAYARAWLLTHFDPAT
jgi:RNA polymerase sigma factor (TIGR02999 family)